MKCLVQSQETEYVAKKCKIVKMVHCEQINVQHYSTSIFPSTWNVNITTSL